LAQIILILQSTKTVENLAQHCNMVTWRWRHIWRHQKCHLHTKTDIKQKAFQGKKHDTASQLL